MELQVGLQFKYGRFLAPYEPWNRLMLVLEVNSTGTHQGAAS